MQATPGLTQAGQNQAKRQSELDSPEIRICKMI